MVQRDGLAVARRSTLTRPTTVTARSKAAISNLPPPAFPHSRPGVDQAFSLEVEQVLYDEKSSFQHVQVFKSRSYGNVLVLDGVVQVRASFFWTARFCRRPPHLAPLGSVPGS